MIIVVHTKQNAIRQTRDEHFIHKKLFVKKTLLFLCARHCVFAKCGPLHCVMMVSEQNIEKKMILFCAVY